MRRSLSGFAVSLQDAIVQAANLDKLEKFLHALVAIIAFENDRLWYPE